MSEQTEQLVEEKTIGDVDSVEDQSVEEQPAELAEGTENSVQVAEAETTTDAVAESTSVDSNGTESTATPTASDTITSDANAAQTATPPTVEASETGVSETETSNTDAAATADSSTADSPTASNETEATASEPDASAGDDESEDDDDEDGKTRVVRMLAVGQEVDGEVKRITDFGAFVDIGVGRDGLLHISELSVQRVGKVSDVLKEGQGVTVWIKDLDRARNRISLTLISPDTKTIRDLEKGEVVEGTVTRILPYGAFIDIGVGRDALLHVREMSEGYVKRPEDVVTVGETLEARIVELSRRRNRIDLSLKGLRPEPEAAEAALPSEPEEEFADDPYEDVEILSPMELAFKRAMEASDDEFPTGKRDRRRKKGSRRNQDRSLQDEIIERTLGNRKK